MVKEVVLEDSCTLGGTKYLIPAFWALSSIMELKPLEFLITSSCNEALNLIRERLTCDCLVATAAKVQKTPTIIAYTLMIRDTLLKTNHTGMNPAIDTRLATGCTILLEKIRSSFVHVQQPSEVAGTGTAREANANAHVHMCRRDGRQNLYPLCFVDHEPHTILVSPSELGRCHLTLQRMWSPLCAPPTVRGCRLCRIRSFTRMSPLIDPLHTDKDCAPQRQHKKSVYCPVRPFYADNP